MAIEGFAASSMVWVHDLERVWWHRVVDHYRKHENRLGLGTGKLFEKGLRLAKCLFGGVGQVIMRVPTSYFAKFPRQLSRVRCGCRACVSFVSQPLHHRDRKSTRLHSSH